MSETCNQFHISETVSAATCLHRFHLPRRSDSAPKTLCVCCSSAEGFFFFFIKKQSKNSLEIHAATKNININKYSKEELQWQQTEKCLLKNQWCKPQWCIVRMEVETRKGTHIFSVFIMLPAFHMFHLFQFSFSYSSWFAGITKNTQKAKGISSISKYYPSITRHYP